MTLTNDILKNLVCPKNKHPLFPITPDQLEKLNNKIEAGEIKTRAGNLVSSTLDGGFIREDLAVVYPVIDQLPIFLCDDALITRNVFK